MIALVLVGLTFTAPADSAADRTLNVWQPCAAYRAHVEQPALTLFLPVWDSLATRQLAPAMPGVSQRGFVDVAPVGTWNVTLEAADARGNWAHPGNWTALHFVGAVAAESCCSRVGPAGPRPSPDPFPLRSMGRVGGWAHYVGSPADSGVVRILTTEEQILEDAALTCGWFHYIARRGAREACP